MITGVTNKIIEIIGEEIMAEVAVHPEVKDAENVLNALMEIIFEGNPELFDKVENAIYEYSETFAKHTFPMAVTYGMQMMNDINQLINQPNTPT